jgi:3-hydroxyisobutyrate dehydrogenase-like beta-hydroxyacid dehydrogenase
VGEGELARIVKLCRNLFLGGVAASMAETSILAQASGICREAFLACPNKSVVGSQFTRYKTLAYVNLDFEPTFTSRLLCKDFALGLAAAREREVPMPVARPRPSAHPGTGGTGGYGDVDFAAFIAQKTE